MKRLVSLVLIALFISAPALPAYAKENAPVKKWTIMAFINADNNLDQFGVDDVLEMEKAGISNDVNVIVQLDRYKNPARIYSVNERAADAKADDWCLRSKRIADIGEADMGDYKEFVKFVNWSVNNYPAERYMAIIWNHGGGWKKGNSRIPVKGISYDDESGNHISTWDLGRAMEAVHGILGRKLDIFGMDACLMQMMEVAYEVRENASYICASEETEPGEGWPYDLLLAPLYKNPSMSAEEFAKLEVQAYFQFYYSYVEPPSDSPYFARRSNALRVTRTRNTTQSAVDCSKIEDLAIALDGLSKAVIEALPSDADLKKAIASAVVKSQKFNYGSNLDIADFVYYVRENTKNEKVKEAAQKALMAYKPVVLASKTTGDAMRDATGLAIYLPQDDFSGDYSKLKYSARLWDDMVTAFHATSPVYDDGSQGDGGGAGDDSDW